MADESYVVHSAETYVHEPADLWSAGLPPEFRGEAWQLISKDDRFVWMSHDEKPLAAPGEAGRKKQEPTTAEQLTARLDGDQITGAVLYPSIAQRAYAICYDSEKLSAFLEPYNKWILELAAQSPDRFESDAAPQRRQPVRGR